MIAGIIVRPPFISGPTCLPILFRLWAGKDTASPVQLAGQLLNSLTDAFSDQKIHVVGDAAYYEMSLVVAGTTITARLPATPRLVTLWYATSGHHRGDQTARQRAEPWYTRQDRTSVSRTCSSSSAAH